MNPFLISVLHVTFSQNVYMHTYICVYERAAFIERLDFRDLFRLIIIHYQLWLILLSRLMECRLIYLDNFELEKK